jgi:thiamine kinase-like enzyme
MENLIDEKILTNVKEILKPRTISEISIQSGGNARVLFKLELDSGEFVLLRIFKNSVFSSQEKDRFYFKILSDMKMAAGLIYQDETFRLEEYLKSKNIKACELINHHRELAYILGKIHSLEKDVNETQALISKKINNELIDSFNKKIADEKNEADIQTLAKISESNFVAEKEFIENLVKDEELVISHNDVWVNNILVLDDTNRVKLVDYEVMGVNFRPYDLGKLIFESIFERHTNGLMYRLEHSQFPGKEDIIKFILDYLASIELDIFPLDYSRDEVKERLLKINSKDDLLKKINRLYFGIYKGIIASCFYLTFMGVICGRELTKELDMFEFGVDHFKLYWEYKEIYNSLTTITEI